MEKQENTNNTTIPMMENFKDKGILIGLPVPPGAKIKFYDHGLWSKIEGPQLGSIEAKMK